MLFAEGRLQLLGRGDVRKRDHNAVNPVVQGAVGHDACGKPAPVCRADRFFHNHQGPELLSYPLPNRDRSDWRPDR